MPCSTTCRPMRACRSNSVIHGDDWSRTMSTLCPPVHGLRRGDRDGPGRAAGAFWGRIFSLPIGLRHLHAALGGFGSDAVDEFQRVVAPGDFGTVGGAAFFGRKAGHVPDD